MNRLICQLLVTAFFLSGFTFTSHADALDNWTSGIVSTNPFGNTGMGLQILGVAYGNGKFVGVGQYIEDDYGFAEISSDGTNWTISTPYDGSILDLYDVTFANGMFVASGWDDYGGNNLYNSTNGNSWNSHVSQIANIYRVIYGNNLFVAVGDGNLVGGIGQTNKNIYTSLPNINWTARSSGAPVNDVDSLSDVAYGAGIYVAVGRGNSGTWYFHTSALGTTWARTASPYPLTGNISYCNGLFFAPSGPGTNLVSANGIAWSALTNNTATTFRRIIYTNGLYLAFSQASIFTSTDETNWIQRNLNAPTNNDLQNAVFASGKVVAAGYLFGVPPHYVYLPIAYISDPLVSLGMNSGSPSQVKISGVQGLSYGIQYSSTLNPPSWQTGTNFIMSSSPSIWTDGTATNSQRYYRGEWLP
jgi:hypothetical protein